MNDKLRITTILGTRPEIIRLSSIIKKFDHYFSHRVIHTGQNSQPELSTVFYEDLDLREPDLYLGLNVNSLGTFLGELYPALENEFLANRPNAIVILGDTNSALVSILAKRMKIPVYHLEAGNRSFDANVPEEINRKVIDHSSDFNLCYTRHAASNLEKEGVDSRYISVIGSPLCEVINSISPKVKLSKVIQNLKLIPNNYFLVSLHRQENIDSEARLNQVIACLNSLVSEFHLPVIVSAHPRLTSKISNLKQAIHPSIQLLKPFGFADFLHLQISSKLVISDSGSISEEAAISGFRAVTLRDSMERPEALEAGTIIMTSTEVTHFMHAVRIALDSPKSLEVPHEYLIPDTSTRVVNFLISTIGQYEFWNGIRNP